MNDKRLYWVWCDMRQRCTNPKHRGFKNYGGRGIAHCSRWTAFANFVSDMGPRPDGGMLERINIDGNYEPGNCRWATRAEQNSNRRNCIYVEFHGERMTLKEASRRAGLKYRRVHKRITEHGWSVDAALTLPIGQPWGTGRASRV
jgi:hypothetical protein